MTFKENLSASLAHVSMLDDSISGENCKCLETELNSSENRVSVCVV